MGQCMTVSDDDYADHFERVQKGIPSTIHIGGQQEAEPMLPEEQELYRKIVESSFVPSLNTDLNTGSSKSGKKSKGGKKSKKGSKSHKTKEIIVERAENRDTRGQCQSHSHCLTKKELDAHREQSLTAKNILHSAAQAQKKAQPKSNLPAEQLERMLDVIANEVFPKTRRCVTEEGNKVFGAAVLKNNASLDTLVADTNHEMECPLYHGEIYVIHQWTEKTPAEQRGEVAGKSIFLSTHEPCCMCISSIVWAGFKKVYYLFPYETTSEQGIPHDINIMHELWGVQTYRKKNEFCTSECIIDLVDALPDSEKRTELKQKIADLTAQYEKLSNVYHSEKVTNTSNSLAFD